jgi:site-specific DNA-methyltransferase (adenine-specific)
MQLIYGDCLEKMKDIPDKSIDMILCDLPYGTTACKWDVVIPFEPLWEQYKRIIKDKGAIVLFANQPFTTLLISSNLSAFKYCWIWDKVRGSNFATVKIRPFNAHEDIAVFYDKQPTYFPQKIEGKPYTQKQGYVGKAKQTGLHRKDVVTVNEGDRYPLSILKFSKESGAHPTQKPVPLLEYLIKTYTLEGEIVLDNTMGSGSTGVACVNTNRDFIGIEKDEDYFLIAKQRIKDAMKEHA